MQNSCQIFPGVYSIFRDSIKIRSWILQNFLGIYGKFVDTCKICQEVPGFNGILSDFSQEFVVFSGILSLSLSLSRLFLLARGGA